VVSLRETGERGLLSRLAEMVGEDGGSTSLIRGIGDDAAIWQQPASGLVATTDMLVEGVHFDLAFTSWRDLGWKALAVNLSDVAAMGATPLLALVSLGLRPDTALADVAAFYDGMRALASLHGCAIAGGDTVSVPHDLVINVVALGSVGGGETETLLRRDRGRPGDVIAVTGRLGASAAGLRLLRRGSRHAGHAALRAAHLRPEPRIAAGRALRRAGVRCAMDLSDGLLEDLNKLCAQSGCGADVHEATLPVHPDAKKALPELALDLALGGGEDYELLCAAPAAVMAEARAALDTIGVALTEIGRLVPGDRVRLLDSQGRERTPPPSGWDHFASGE
jgi:thiamine-monophosphate kinase